MALIFQALPEPFEKESYDCSWGPSCSFHTDSRHGKWVFRWLNKSKRAIDDAVDRVGWTLVNRGYFPQAPRIYFTAAGGIELGDAILAFIPAQQALGMRAAPALRSQERIRGRMTAMPTASDEEPYVLMSPNPKDRRIYQPKITAPPENEVPAESEVATEDFA